MLLGVLLAVVGWNAVSAVLVTRPVAYLRIPDVGDRYGLFKGTAEKMAYDNDTRILYIIGSRSEQIRVVDMNDPANPQLLIKKAFVGVSDGVPTAVAFCRSGQRAYLGVAFAAETRLNEGHVELFEPFKRGDFVLNKLTTHNTDTNPRVIKFTHDCNKFIVACEGLPGTRQGTGTFEDPLPHIDIFEKNPTSWTKYTVNFRNAHNLDKARWIYRRAGFTQINDLEPSDISISGGKVYVTFGENNALGVFDHNNLAGGETIYSFGSKSWATSALDTSDRDSSVKLASRNVNSFYQPESIMAITYQNTVFLATANTGGRKVYKVDPDGVDFSEGVRARLFDKFKINPDYYASIQSDITVDAEMGRLFVSNLEDQSDGWNNLRKVFDSVHAYGGRSWSLWRPDGTNIYDSGSDFEFEVREYNSSVFNSLCDSAGRSPPQDFDRKSPETGVTPTCIAKTFFNGKEHVAIGSGTMGGLFFYSLSGTGAPTGHFESYTRIGGINGNWNELYNGDDAGTPHISDMSFIEYADGKQYLLVIGSQTGALSVHELYDGAYP